MALAQGSLSSSLLANIMKAPVGLSTLWISLSESSFANQWNACLHKEMHLLAGNVQNHKSPRERVSSELTDAILLKAPAAVRSYRKAVMRDILLAVSRYRGSKSHT